MSVTITINDINNLTDMERTVLRLVADNSVTASLKETVRNFALLSGDANPVKVDETDRRFVAAPSTADVAKAFGVPAPIDPPEVLSPHVQVVEPATNPFALLTPVAAPVIPASAELDAQGFPWDKRIHSSSRAKVANGNWRYARNLEGSVIQAVEAELRAVQNAGRASTHGSEALDADATKLNAVFGQGAAGATLADVGVAAPSPAVPLPPMPIIPAVPAPPAPTGEVTTFAQLMQRITPHIVSTKLSQAHIQATCASLGLPHLAALGARPDLIPAALVELEKGVMA